MRLIDAYELERHVRNFHGRGKKTMLEYIEAMPTIQPQGIDKDRLLKEIKGWQEDIYNKEYDAYIYDYMFERFYKIANEQPTLDVPDTNVGKMPQSYKDRLIEFLKKERGDWKVLACEQHEEAGDGGMDAIDSVLDWVNQQPTSDGWIPCSERLPEINGKYLCSYGDGHVGTFCFTTNLYLLAPLTFGRYKYNEHKCFYECDSMYGYYEIENVTAWQQLPPAYKESE